jgi:hypothetical protein
MVVRLAHTSRWCTKRCCDIGTTIWKCAKFKSGCGPIHVHMLALDGVYTVGESGKAKFHRVKAPNQSKLRTLLNRVIQAVVRRLEKEGLLIPDPEQPWLDLGIDEPIDAVIAASTEASDRRYRIAMGPHSGSRTITLHDPSFVRTDRPVKALTADRDGFSSCCCVMSALSAGSIGTLMPVCHQTCNLSGQTHSQS